VIVITLKKPNLQFFPARCVNPLMVKSIKTQMKGKIYHIALQPESWQHVQLIRAMIANNYWVECVKTSKYITLFHLILATKNGNRKELCLWFYVEHVTVLATLKT
jgi:hypothetical protein